MEIKDDMKAKKTALVILLAGLSLSAQAGETKIKHLAPDIVRDGVDAIAEIPEIAAWNCGWLAIAGFRSTNSKNMK